MGSQFPQLRGLSEDVARKWHGAAVREANASLPAWMKVFRRVWLAYLIVCLCIGFGVWLIPRHWPGVDWIRRYSGLIWVPFHALNVTLIVVVNRRVQKHRKARIEAELAAGRFRHCIVCDYDLRGTPGDTCPECGASVLVPKKASGNS
jgi:hypothetical protein